MYIYLHTAFQFTLGRSRRPAGQSHTIRSFLSSGRMPVRRQLQHLRWFHFVVADENKWACLPFIYYLYLHLFTTQISSKNTFQFQSKNTFVFQSQMLAWFVFERRPAKNRHRYDGHSFPPTLEFSLKISSTINVHLFTTAFQFPFTLGRRPAAAQHVNKRWLITQSSSAEKNRRV